MKKFKMPDTYECICRKGLTYDKESKTCIDCLKAQKTMENLVDIVLSTENPELILALLFVLIQREVEKEKEIEKND